MLQEHAEMARCVVLEDNPASRITETLETLATADLVLLHLQHLLDPTRIKEDDSSHGPTQSGVKFGIIIYNGGNSGMYTFHLLDSSPN